MSVARIDWRGLALLAALAAACGSDGSPSGKVGRDAGVEPDATADAKPDAGDAGAGDARPRCGAQEDGTILDTSATGGCYYFFCRETEESLRSKVTQGACTSATDVAVQCEGQSVRTVSECARNSAGLLQDGVAAFKAGTAACARNDKRLKAAFSDACLACYLESAACSVEACIGECLSGDTVECDDCREKAGCTPNLYKCGGLPNPLEQP